MSTPSGSPAKRYFHDRFVLLMLTTNVFLTLVTVASVLFRLGDTSNSYIKAYRSNLGVNAYQAGEVDQVIAFAVFAIIVLIGNVWLGIKLYGIRKQAAWTVMILSALLLLLALIVSNSLLRLR